MSNNDQLENIPNARPEEMLSNIDRIRQAGISSRATLEETREFVSRYREEVDYGKLWSKDDPVLFVCERHMFFASKDEIIGQMEGLKDLGMTHLAIEMIRSADQDKIDKYAEGELKREAIIELLIHWNKREGMAEKYVQVIDKAISLGIKVIGIDLPSMDNGDLQDFKKRDENWSHIIANQINSKDKARVLVFCGVNHAAYYPAVDRANNILSSKYGISSKVIDFTSGQLATDAIFSIDEKIDSAASSLGISGDYFMIRGNVSENRPADGYIHLIQKEKRL